jgi:hypothetical protein
MAQRGCDALAAPCGTEQRCALRAGAHAAAPCVSYAARPSPANLTRLIDLWPFRRVPPKAAPHKKAPLMRRGEKEV